MFGLNRRVEIQVREKNRNSREIDRYDEVWVAVGVDATHGAVLGLER